MRRIKKKLRILLDLVTRFTQDDGMKFGESKCAYNIIVWGKRKHQGEDLKVRSLTVKELPEKDSYKDLGLDESIGSDGPFNKERIKTEYKRRVRKIWSSELNNINKVNAHNTFAVPIITPTIRILSWTKKEIKDLDILTRRQLTINGSYHPASDVHRLYSRRKEGGRGLASIEEVYIRRTTGIAEHLEKAYDMNSIITLVKTHEKTNIIRLAAEFKELYMKENKVNINMKEEIKKEHEKAWKDKVTHGHYQGEIEKDNEINENDTNAWLKQRLSSHLEGFICAIQEQELNTRDVQRRREKDQVKRNNINTKCRICNDAQENIFHLICSCSHLAHTIYLADRDNQVARILYQEITKSNITHQK